MVYLICFVCCAGKTTRASDGNEARLAAVKANVQTFPEGAYRQLPVLHKYTHEDVTLLAWSKDFARGHAVLLEIESEKSLSEMKLHVDGKALPMIAGEGCVFALFANHPASGRKSNKVSVFRGKSHVADFQIPIVRMEYPVAVSKLTVNNFSNQSKPMSKETIKFIQESYQKKIKAFVSAPENYLGSALRYPRDEHKITSPFYIKRVYERFKVVKGKKKKLKGKTSYHGGTDLKGLTGAPIFAIADGVVNLADRLYYDGNIVVIDHGNGVLSGYMHQSELVVKKGDRVKAGQLLGKTGATGMVTGPHLHIFLSVHGVKADALSLLVLPLRPAK
jgi:murein DD-endopeptidase